MFEGGEGAEVGEGFGVLVICDCGRVVWHVFAEWSQWARRVECRCDPARVERAKRARVVRAFARGVALSTRRARAGGR